ncbi:MULTISPECIES: hypothetical protein [Staphylococcus]|uniref:hypothetical protein n=1 Tax=Staphylococcus TaxID=1279 RepID=UPI0021D09F29|nr:hypothetical protein [Staphylococcus sp. IVB6181]UXV35256.1 hypothetical protein MUA90_01605 [Staphylococcus sp. IVB6181]
MITLLLDCIEWLDGDFVFFGLLALFKHWVQDEQRVDVDTLIAYIAKLSFNGPLRLIASDNI